MNIDTAVTENRNKPYIQGLIQLSSLNPNPKTPLLLIFPGN